MLYTLSIYRDGKEYNFSYTVLRTKERKADKLSQVICAKNEYFFFYQIEGFFLF
jgi:hypothetical protein